MGQRDWMDWLYWEREAERTGLRPTGEVKPGAFGGGLQGAQDPQNDVQTGESNSSLTNVSNSPKDISIARQRSVVCMCVHTVHDVQKCAALFLF